MADEADRYLDGLDSEARQYLEALGAFVVAVEGAAAEYATDPKNGAASAVAAAFRLLHAVGVHDPSVTRVLGDLLAGLHDLTRGHAVPLLQPDETTTGRPPKVATDEVMGRAHAAAAVDALMAAGKSLVAAEIEVGRELGVTSETLHEWRKLLRATGKADADAKRYYEGLLRKARGQDPRVMAAANSRAARLCLAGPNRGVNPE